MTRDNIRDMKIKNLQKKVKSLESRIKDLETEVLRILGLEP